MILDMEKIKNLKISTKLAGFTSLLLVLTISVCILVADYHSSNTLMEKSLENAENDIKTISDDFTDFLEVPQQDIRYLSNLPLLEKFINYPSDAKYDSIGNIDPEYLELNELLINTFIALSDAKRIYMQLRYIDDQGNEVIRIDNVNGIVNAITGKDLQNKSGSGYFKETMRLNKEDFYVSQLNLNKEHGKIQEPYNPVIRYALPVFDNIGQRKGIVIANVFMSKMLKNLAAGLKGNTYILDNDGYYLQHPDPQLSWGRDLKHKIIFKNEHSKSVVNEVLSTQSFITIEDDKVITSSPIFPYEANKKYFLIAINEIDKTTILSAVYELRFILIITGLCIVLLAIALSIFFANVFSKPLLNLTGSIISLTEGNMPNQLPVKSKDEIGMITAKINELISSINKMSKFAIEVGKGNFETKSDFGTKIILGEALNEMKDSLAISVKNDEERNWTAEGLAIFGNILRDNHADLDQLSSNILSKLIGYLGVNQGRVFIINSDNPSDIHLELLACYAWGKKKFLGQRLDLGEGLTGQCWQEGEAIYMNNIPVDYVEITSGVGKALPRCVLIVPLKVNGEIFGILEVASFDELTENHLSFVEKVAEMIASTLSSVKTNENTKYLLEKSQAQAEELRATEEEMRQNQEELQSTQEEMQRQKNELEEELRIVRKQLDEHNTLEETV